MRHLLTVLALVAGLLVCHGQEKPSLLSEETREGVVFRLNNPLPAPVTVTLNAELLNMRSSERLPKTIIVPASSSSHVATLSTHSRSLPFRYTYSWRWIPGSRDAKPDHLAVYQLPFALGTRHKLIQGHGGLFSHMGENRYALDWEMPIGTAVCAARDGIVIQTKADSNNGGPDEEKFFSEANYIQVLHSDGTIAAYLHLQQNGVRVRPGQSVKRGEVIGYSGNTGFSDGPHLHFHVQVALPEGRHKTIPVLFQTVEGVKLPKDGIEYTAVAVR